MSSEKRYSVFSYSATRDRPWGDQRPEGQVDDRNAAEAFTRAAVSAGRDSAHVIGPAGVVFHWDRDEAAAASSPVRRFLDLSTGHLPEAILNDLDGSDGVTAYPLPHGALMWVPDDPAAHAADYEEVPAEVLAVQVYARSLGCDYVMFDADADAGQVAGLPFWVW